MPVESFLFGSTKQFTRSFGLSCAFRQWRAASHCRLLHGYALQVTLDFRAKIQDENGWVVDFGDFRDIKDWLGRTFDHKVLVALSDPALEKIAALQDAGLAKIVYMTEVGCEHFALTIFNRVEHWLKYKELQKRVELYKVTVAEHEGNSAYIVNPNAAR